MPVKKHGNRKNPKNPKENEARIPSKKDTFIRNKRPINPTPTEYSPKGIHVTGLATAGKKKKPK